MKKAMTLCLALGLMLGGCGASETVTEQPETATAESSAPVAKQDTKQAKASTKASSTKGKATTVCKHPYGKEVQLKNGDKVCCLLEDTGRQLSQKAARTITPNKNNKHVKQVGKEYVATYTHIDADAVSTSMTPSTVTKGNYVGRIRYTETTYQCKGKTKKEALAATNCTPAGSRNVTEMINFDGKKWQY